jgi:hypothetical protein
MHLTRAAVPFGAIASRSALRCEKRISMML